MDIIISSREGEKNQTEERKSEPKTIILESI
jgi:hypothetical protein